MEVIDFNYKSYSTRPATAKEVQASVRSKWRRLRRCAKIRAALNKYGLGHLVKISQDN